MEKFEEYIKARYPVDYEHLKEKYPNVPVGEFYGDEKDLWNYRQAEVDEYKMVSESIEDMYLLERKKVKAVEQVLIDLKESMTNFKEMDLYDKGVRVVTDYIIRDLEKALRGEHE